MKIISLALWGDNVLYWNSMSSVVKGFHALYPGWQIRIHTDEATYGSHWGKMLKAMQLHKVISVSVHEAAPLTKAMMWRVKPLWEPDAEVVLCRDIDSLPTVRERECVDEFLRSPCIAHGINDHPCHTTPLMGGLCGFKKEVASFWPSWDSMISTGPLDWATKGNDQFSLYYNVWPKVKARAMVHRFEGNYQPDAAFVLSCSHPIPDMPAEIKSHAPAPKIGLASYDRPAADAFFSAHIDPNINTVIDNAKKETGYHQTSSRFVIFSINEDAVSAFFAPMTARLWWKTMGYAPVCAVVGNTGQWHDAMRLCLLKLAESRTQIVNIPPMDGHSSETVAQSARLFAGGMEGFWAEDFILTSDVDVWPVNRESFYKNKARIGGNPTAPVTRFSIWNSNTPGTYPISYLGAQHWAWEQLMHVRTGDAVSALQKQLDTGLGKGRDPEACRSYDTLLFGVRFKEWLSNHPEHASGIEYFTREDDRLDMRTWKAGDPLSMASTIDIQMPKANLLSSCRAALSILAGDDYAWYDTYMSEFFRLTGWPDSK